MRILSHIRAGLGLLCGIVVCFCVAALGLYLLPGRSRTGAGTAASTPHRTINPSFS
jgi:hypothetical protein